MIAIPILNVLAIELRLVDYSKNVAKTYRIFSSVNGVFVCYGRIGKRLTVKDYTFRAPGPLHFRYKAAALRDEKIRKGYTLITEADFLIDASLWTPTNPRELNTYWERMIGSLGVPTHAHVATELAIAELLAIVEDLT